MFLAFFWKGALRAVTAKRPLIEVKLHVDGKDVSLGIFSGNFRLREDKSQILRLSLLFVVHLTVNNSLRCFFNFSSPTLSNQVLFCDMHFLSKGTGGFRPFCRKRNGPAVLAVLLSKDRLSLISLSFEVEGSCVCGL